MHAETICVCKDGYTGDPDNLSLGCSEHSSSSFSNNANTHGQSGANIQNIGGCQAKNETYTVGAEWFDGCDYRCICSEKKEILCQVCFECIC